MAKTQLLLVCLALAAPLVPATASAAPLPATSLVLSTRSEMGMYSSTTQLTCEPAGGRHKKAKEACADLATVDSDFTKLAASGAMCTMELNTTKATLRGKWRGKKVFHEETYSNPCVLHVNTGSVFDF
ncbi:SSI family serine proteinase inhibitor [Lentzea sp. NPDC005914]|uniref:SSI family serine proteinase inhibitor n=1 Tax=Lentzea sp. NPDC005914 TaxID=3154572 RepID=UPI0033EC0D7F